MAYDSNRKPGARTPASAQSTYANPMSAGQRRTPDQIEDDIEATRARIEARLEGLSSQTAPARLLETTLGADLSSPTDTLNSLYLRAKSNPISAGLIGAGLLALYLGRKTEDPVAIARARREAEFEEGREVPGPATRDAAERVAYDIAALKGHARAVGEDVSAARARLTTSAQDTRDATVSSSSAASTAVSDTASSLADQAKETYENAAESVSSTYDSVASSVSSAYEGASERLSHAPAYARERARYAGSWVQENPIAAGLIGLAAGAVAASVFATTRSNPPRRQGRETRDLYREADGYSTSEELQRYSTRPVSASTGYASRPPRASASTDTRTSAVPSAANPARSTASQAARRAPATAPETIGKTTSTSAKSTVGKTTTKPKTTKVASSASRPAKSASAAKPAAKSGSIKPATKPNTGGRATGTASSSNKPAPSAGGTTYTASPSKGGSKTPKK